MRPIGCACLSWRCYFEHAPTPRCDLISSWPALGRRDVNPLPATPSLPCASTLASQVRRVLASPSPIAPALFVDSSQPRTRRAPGDFVHRSAGIRSCSRCFCHRGTVSRAMSSQQARTRVTVSYLRILGVGAYASKLRLQLYIGVTESLWMFAVMVSVLAPAGPFGQGLQQTHCAPGRERDLVNFYQANAAAARYANARPDPYAMVTRARSRHPVPACNPTPELRAVVFHMQRSTCSAVIDVMS